jgi:hypothetical protein
MWSREKENSSVRGTHWGGRLPGEGCMNDYFDMDLFYGHRLKATVKSGYFRTKARPSMTVYGMKGMYIKEVKDKQEEHLKMFVMPGEPGFGEDKPSEYGTVKKIRKF